MDTLTELNRLGLELPSPAYLLGAVLFGLVGYAAWRRGRQAARPALTWAGVALMLYPYGVSSTWVLWCVGVTLCAWVFARWN